MTAGDNIVERLREFMLLEAASEIEKYKAENGQLRDEIERLKQALRLSDACRVHAEQELKRSYAAYAKTILES